MIHFIRLLSLRNNELLQFFQDIITRCEQFDLAALLLTGLLTPFKQEVSKLEAVFKKMSGSKITDLIVAIDDQRDDAIIGIKKTCEGFEYHFDENFALAAKAIIESYKPYNEPIAELNYSAETAAIDSITKKWENDAELTAAFTTLNLTPWIGELKAYNTSFKEAYQNRVTETLETTGDSFSTLREPAGKAYTKLCQRINAYAEIGEEAAYQELAGAINIIIDKYDMRLKLRKAQKQEEEHEDTAMA